MGKHYVNKFPHGNLKYVGGDIKAVRKVLMKNTLKLFGIITLVVVIAVCFASCDFLSDKDKDDDGSNGIATKFEGTWNSVGYPDTYYIFSKNTILDKIYVSLGGGRDNQRGTFTFTENELKVIITGRWDATYKKWEKREKYLICLHQYTFIDDNTFVIVDNEGGDTSYMGVGTYNKISE